MFSGLGSQISGFVSQKMGKGEGGPEGGEPAPQEMMIDENGQEVPVNPAPPAGAMGFAQGLMAKAAAAKDMASQQAGALGGLKVCCLYNTSYDVIYISRHKKRRQNVDKGREKWRLEDILVCLKVKHVLYFF